MTTHDLDILNKCHDEAVKELASAAQDMAEKICERKWPTQEEVDRYKKARLGVQATARDLEYCMNLELAELLEA